MTEQIINQFFNNNIIALAKILTLVESRERGFEKILSEITSRGLRLRCQAPQAYTLGITGPPGDGKSTLIDKLTHKFRAEGLTVGIVAIDPSSPFSGGALLGDRIRMQAHSGDSGVFIRSIGSRGSHGGLSRATRDIVRVMDAFGFNITMVETVGVGQTELDIMEIADTTVVVLVPEAGDMVQSLKAGLLEIADIFVVNKSDRSGAKAMAIHLQGLVAMNKNTTWTIPVIKAAATTGAGINDLSEAIQKHRLFLKEDKSGLRKKAEMKKNELVEIVTEQFEKKLREQMISNQKLAQLTRDVVEGRKNPYEAADEILKRLT